MRNVWHGIISLDPPALVPRLCRPQGNPHLPVHPTMTKPCLTQIAPLLDPGTALPRSPGLSLNLDRYFFRPTWISRSRSSAAILRSPKVYAASIGPEKDEVARPPDRQIRTGRPGSPGRPARQAAKTSVRFEGSMKGMSTRSPPLVSQGRKQNPARALSIL